MKSLQRAYEELQSHRQRIEQSGSVAPANVWIDIYRPGGRDVDYARLRSDVAMFDGGKKTIGLKRVGSDEHREWEQRIKRRDALAEIERRSLVISAMLGAPIWEPDGDYSSDEPEMLEVVKAGHKNKIAIDAAGQKYACKRMDEEIAA